MRKEDNHKEILTYANIRRDLRRQLCESWLLMLVSMVFLVWFIYEFHQYPELLFAPLSKHPGRAGLPGWVLLLAMPFFLYVVIKKAWTVACGFRQQPYMAKDKLVSTDEGSRYVSSRWRTSSWGVLHFNGYGDYQVPDTNYSWSKEYAMTAEGVCRTSFAGDEFYLVLSKPHSGKILLAYNANLFQLEGGTE